jgi:4-hydroxy-tetrahydrodipicolinate synthase
MDPRLVQSFKAALDLSGRYGGPVRPPRLALDDEGMERVRAAL